jgi:hypothetical protein
MQAQEEEFTLVALMVPLAVVYPHASATADTDCATGSWDQGWVRCVGSDADGSARAASFSRVSGGTSKTFAIAAGGFVARD